MGIYDRDYARPEGYGQQYNIGGGFRGLPPVVKWLLISNFAIFIFANLLPKIGDHIYGFGAVFPVSLGWALQLWRVITYQFLHAGLMHIVFNLIVLYFMGPFLERAWGSKAFLKFYLICGAAGGVVYTFLVLLKVLPVGIMVGASGAIYGVMMAIAVMYPTMRVLLWGIIPMTMVRLVVLVVIVSLINIAFSKNVGGEVAHLTGLAAGFIYIKYKPMLTQWRMNRNKGAWAQKMQNQMWFQQEVDRILDKVHKEGVNSLTIKEKQILQEATRREQQERR